LASVESTRTGFREPVRVVPSHEAVARWTGQSFASSGTEPPRSWGWGVKRNCSGPALRSASPGAD